LWRQGFVEAVTPPSGPFQVVAQQILAMVLQQRGAQAPEVRTAIQGAFRDVPGEIVDQTLAHLTAEDILRKATTTRTSFIAELTGSGAVSAFDLAHTMSSAFAAPLIDLDAIDTQRGLGWRLAGGRR
jgi:hypothetical protein